MFNTYRILLILSALEGFPLGTLIRGLKNEFIPWLCFGSTPLERSGLAHNLRGLQKRLMS